MTSVLVRLLPSRVGFAERDASRPAFGGSSLVSLTRHTCVGGGPLGPRLCVRPSVTSKKERDHTGSLGSRPNRERETERSELAWRSHGLSAAKAERSEGRRLSAAREHE